MLHKTTAHYRGGGRDGTDTAAAVLRSGREIKFFLKKDSFPWGFGLSPLRGAADVGAGRSGALLSRVKGFSTTFGTSTGTKAADPEMPSYGPGRGKEGWQRVTRRAPHLLDEACPSGCRGKRG